MSWQYHFSKRKHYTLACFVAALVLGILSGCSKQAKLEARLKEGDRLFAEGSLEKAKDEYLIAYNLDYDSFDAMIGLARVFHHQGRLRHAYKALKTCMELDPADLETRILLSQTYLRAGDLDKAREQALIIIDNLPDDPTALFIFAQSVEGSAAVGKAIDFLRSLPETRSGQNYRSVALAILESKRGRFGEARTLLDQAVESNPDNSFAHLASARLHWSQQEFERAAKAFASAVSSSRGDDFFLLEFANFRRKTGAIDQAEAILRQSLSAHPEHLPSLLELADISLEKQAVETGLEAARRVLEIDARHPGALLLSGKLEMLAGSPREAARTFERMAQYYPTSTKAHFELATACLALNEPDKAIIALHQAKTLTPDSSETSLLIAELEVSQADLNGAIIELTEFATRNPDNSEVKLYLAQILREKGDYRQAMEIYGDLLQSGDGGPEVTYHMGTSLIQLKQYAAGYALLERTLAQDPTHDSALEQLTMIDIARGEFKRCLERLDAFAGANDPSEVGHFLRGFLLRKQGDYRSAEAELKQAIALDPQQMRSYLLLTEIYFAESREEAAIDSLTAAVEQNPDDIHALMLLGSLLAKKEMAQEAVRRFSQVLEVEPDFSPALNNLAYLHANYLQNLPAGYDYAIRARQLKPNDPDIADTLGWILFKQGKYSWALSLISEAASRLPNNAEIKYHLGTVHYMLGNQAKALVALNEASQQPFPGKSESRDRKAILELALDDENEQVAQTLQRRLEDNPYDTVALLKLSEIQQRNDMYSDATGGLEMILSRNPENVHALTRLAQLKDEVGDRHAAFDLAKRAYAVDPGNTTTVFTLAKLAFDHGDHKWACSLFRACAENQPENQEVLARLSESEFAIGDLSGARSDANQALQLKESKALEYMLRVIDLLENKRSLQSIGSVDPVDSSLPSETHFALTREAEAEFGKAISSYSQILGRYPSFTPAKRRLALLYAKRSTFTPDAYELTLEVFRSNRSDQDVADALALQHYNRKEYNDVIRLLQSGTKSPEMIFYLGMSRYRIKQTSEAEKNLVEALEHELPVNLRLQAQEALSMIRSHQIEL